ncbi:hypothetical protein [Amycolatopsis jejuensis]|uniref:hypothetical protein n=1 Tax=Amycolatopsis jejuensis TaxID=330084 RepID=UPI000526C9EF|nr:hypothetical protein [Amycolatopsis jejuensis]
MIEIRIDRIVLDGVDLSPGQARALRDAVEAALSSLVTGESSWRELRRRKVVGPELDSFSVPAIAEAIARSIHHGIGDASVTP